MASETTDAVRHNSNLYLKNEEKCIIFFYLLILEDLYLKWIIGGVTEVLRKRWAYLRGGGGCEWGVYRRRNTVFNTLRAGLGAADNPQ